jgi:hypothetical protein
MPVFKDVQMTIEKAHVVDTPEYFLVTYKVTINDTKTKEETVVEPLLTATGKFPGFDSAVTYRNQVNRIPITVFK